MINVSIVKTTLNPQYCEILNALQRAFDLIGGIRDIVKDGDMVLINPSRVAPPVEREAGCITIAEIPRAIATLCKPLVRAP